MEIDLDTNPFALTPEQLDRFNITFHSGYNKWTGLRMLEMRPGFARLTFTPRDQHATTPAG